MAVQSVLSFGRLNLRSRFTLDRAETTLARLTFSASHVARIGITTVARVHNTTRTPARCRLDGRDASNAGDRLLSATSHADAANVDFAAAVHVEGDGGFAVAFDRQTSGGEGRLWLEAAVG